MKMPSAIRPARRAGFPLASGFGTALLCLCGSPLCAQAPDRELNYSVGVGAEYSDNITRIADGKISDTAAVVNFSVNGARNSSRLAAQVAADLAYNHYLENTFDDEVVGNALVDIEAQIVRNRLSWFVNDNFGQIRLQALVPVTPDNRENVNVFGTGPRFTQRFGDRTRLTLKGLYEIETYEFSPLDARRTGGDLSLHHDLSPRQFLEITATARETRFDEGDPADDFDLEEYFLTWSATGAKTTLRIDAGESAVQGAGRDDTQALLRLDAERRVGSFGTLTLTVRSQTASAAETFRIEQTAPGPQSDTQRRVAVGEPVSLDYVGLGYELAARRYSVSFGASTERDRYEVARENDSDRRAAQVDVRWFTNAKWTLGAGIETAKESYPATDASFREFTFNLSARANLARTLSLEFSVWSIDRDDAVGTNAYDEMRAKLGLIYSGGAR